ncbi:hypothetical protein GOODEAATRI_032357 [Goodea atripinnis]|uniref:Uncharacterized protein n=1 Tax=Goodea atripinnis TaxID=208336 RepID=A0ABV0Q3S0_9TELE
MLHAFTSALNRWPCICMPTQSWEPEYFAEMDFISPPNAEAQSFTLKQKESALSRFDLPNPAAEKATLEVRGGTEENIKRRSAQVHAFFS